MSMECGQLKELRVKLGFTQQDIAARLKRSWVTINMIDNCRIENSKTKTAYWKLLIEEAKKQGVSI